MIRPVLTQLALFLTPFALYAIFLWATRARVLDVERWSLNTILVLSAASLVLMLGSFLLLAHFSGAPPGSVYIPAQVQDGKLVPGTIR